MSQRNLVILTKIILFYSIFFIFMKMVIIFKGAWLVPNLILIFPFLILALVSAWQVKKSSGYSWIFVLFGAAVIVVVRIYEARFSYWIEQQIQM